VRVSQILDRHSNHGDHPIQLLADTTAQSTYFRWRKWHHPAHVDADRRCRELESEVERLKRLVAELMLDKQMLQDVAKKKW
jgi:putative transposase